INDIIEENEHRVSPEATLHSQAKKLKNFVLSKEKKIMNLEKGKYAIPLQALKKDEDAPSAMADYLSNFAVVTKKDDKLTLSIVLYNQHIITILQMENQEKIFTEAIAEQIKEEKNWRYEIFELNYLPSNLKVRVQYEVEHYGKSFKGDELLRLSFYTDNVEKIDSNLYNNL